jgi:acetyltransferase-like isoleucine patch superfamily enzyme
MGIIRVLYKLFKLIQTQICSLHFIFFTNLLCRNTRVGKNFVANGFISVRLSKESNLVIAHDVKFNNRIFDNYVGLNKRSTIAVVNKAKLTIGHNTGFSNVSIYCSDEINIGSYCNFGGNCFIWDTDFHEIDYLERRKNLNSSSIKTSPINIGDDVFIGANCIILKGVRIGSRSIIGAGSVVSRSIPQDEIWAGNPIRFIRKIN